MFGEGEGKVDTQTFNCSERIQRAPRIPRFSALLLEPPSPWYFFPQSWLVLYHFYFACTYLACGNDYGIPWSRVGFLTLPSYLPKQRFLSASGSLWMAMYHFLAWCPAFCGYFRFQRPTGHYLCTLVKVVVCGFIRTFWVSSLYFDNKYTLK